MRSPDPHHFLWLRILIAGIVLKGSLSAQQYEWITIAGNIGGSGVSDGRGPAAHFDLPAGMVAGGNGNLYVADSSNHTIRKVTRSGVVTTLAGSPQQAGAAEGSGSEARFNRPSDVALDFEGNIFVADSGNQTIRKITPVGDVRTFCGIAGTAGSADGDPATARFTYPTGLAIGADATVYVVDSYSHTIRKISSEGMTSTLAGSAGQIGAADGPGTEARFKYPLSIAVDSNGFLYVTDEGNHVLRKITPDGVVTTLAGSVSEFGGSANGTGSAARFNRPQGVKVDAAGTIFVVDHSNQAIRKVTTTGTVTTPAGTAGSFGFANGLGNAARFWNPSGLALAGDGTLFISEWGNQDIRMMTNAGLVSSFAGGPLRSGNANGLGTAARFNEPEAVTVDNEGTLYVADTRNNLIRKITSTGQASTLAGGSSGFSDGTGSAARFRSPRGIAVDNGGNIYVSDSGNHIIRRITGAGVVSTFAGTPGAQGNVNGQGTAARFYGPAGMVVDSAGNLYVADETANTIRKITAGGLVTTAAGSALSAGSEDGPAAMARFYRPWGVAVDGGGAVLITDRINNTIRKLTPGGQVITIAGRTGREGTDDGAGDVARFAAPAGVAVSASGDAFVSDSLNNRVRKITPAGVVSTIGGSTAFMIGDGGGPLARFYLPIGLTATPAGTVYVADTANHRIVRGVPDTTRPPVLGAPASSAITGRMVTVSFTLPEAALRGSVSLTFAGAVSRTLTLAFSQEHEGDHSLTFDAGDPAIGNEIAAITGGTDVPFGQYTVTLSYRDVPGNAPASATSVNVLIGGPEITVFSGGAAELSDGQEGPVDFGIVRQSFPQTKALTISNTGFGPLVVSTVTAPPGYTVLDLPPLPAIIGVAQSLTFRLRMDAAALGTFAGRVGIESDDLDEAVFDFPVTGIVVSPEIAVHDGNAAAPELSDGQAAPVSLGRNVQGTPGTHLFTIANTGTADLRVSAVTVPAGYTLQNLLALPFTVGPEQSATFQVSLTTLTVGTHTGSVVIASDDLDEAVFDFPLTGEVFIPDPVSGEVSTTTVLNRQTGLREQMIQITNDTTATVPAYNLIIRGLPAGVEVNNASGVRADGSVVVYIRQTMLPHSTQDIVLEYYSANRAPVEMNPQLSTEVVLNPPNLTVPAGDPGLTIDRITDLPGGAMMIEFASTPGRRYQVQYSHDGATWQASLPQIRAASNRTQWTDRGLPRTDSHPATHASRMYRVREIP